MKYETARSEEVSKLKDSVFMITPFKSDEKPDWNKAIVCPSVPDRGVCLQEDEYKYSRGQSMMLEKCLERDCDSGGFSTGEMLIAAGSGFVLGLMLYNYLRNQRGPFLPQDIGSIGPSGVGVFSFP